MWLMAGNNQARQAADLSIADATELVSVEQNICPTLKVRVTDPYLTPCYSNFEHHPRCREDPRGELNTDGRSRINGHSNPPNAHTFMLPGKHASHHCNSAVTRAPWGCMMPSLHAATAWVIHGCHEHSCLGRAHSPPFQPTSISLVEAGML